MTSLFYMLISSIVGSVGWWLGGYFGMGPAFVASTVGSILGLWWAYKLQLSFSE